MIVLWERSLVRVTWSRQECQAQALFRETLGWRIHQEPQHEQKRAPEPAQKKFSQCSKTQCARRREQLTCPDMNSWKTECLEAHVTSVIQPFNPPIGEAVVVCTSKRYHKKRTNLECKRQIGSVCPTVLLSIEPGRRLPSVACIERDKVVAC